MSAGPAPAGPTGSLQSAVCNVLMTTRASHALAVLLIALPDKVEIYPFMPVSDRAMMENMLFTGMVSATIAGIASGYPGMVLSLHRRMVPLAEKDSGL